MVCNFGKTVLLFAMILLTLLILNEPALKVPGNEDFNH